MELRLESRLSLADTVLEMLAEARVVGHGHQPLLNLVGPPGIGKSHMLRLLFARLAAHYAVAALDFAWPEQAWSAVAPALAPLLPHQLSSAAPPELAPIQLRLTRSLPVDFRPGDPWLLLLDGLDDLRHWPALQRALIKPVAERTSGLVVIASRAPVTWHFWELRDRCRTVPLPRLGLQETLDIARHAARAPLARPLHDLALGHPAAIETLLRHFTQAPARDLPDPQIESFSEATQRAVAVIGVLRVAGQPAMERLLRRFLPGWDAAHLDAVLRELRARGQLLARHNLPALVSPALRTTVSAALERFRPAQLAALTAELEAFYFEQALAEAAAPGEALNEWLFFTARPFAGDEERLRWSERLRQLCAAHTADGSGDQVALSAQIYRDEELIERLQQAGRLEILDELLDTSAALGPAVFTQDTELYRAYATELLERLLSPASAEEGGRLRTLLDSAREVVDPFSATELALITARRTGETVHGVRRDLALLVDRGLCRYDAASRKYALDPLVRRLMPPTL